MTFREIIRKKLMEGFININELFYMRNFSILQMHVLRSVAQNLGVDKSPTAINDFLKSPIGIQVMQIYRETLINRFGDSGKGMPNSDESADPGFNPSNIEANQALIQSLSAEIVNRIRGMQ